MMTSDKLLIVDVETSCAFSSGESPDICRSLDGQTTCQVVSVGAITVNPDTLKKISEFYVEIQWDGKSGWNETAEKVHGLSKELLLERGLPSEQAAMAFAEYILSEFGTKMVPTAGHNAGIFDIPFLKHWLYGHQLFIKFSHRIIDTYTLSEFILGKGTSEAAFNLVGVKRTQHNALEDARATLKVLKTVKTVIDTLSQRA